MLSVYPWQEPQWRQICAAIEQGKVPHALLLTGQQGLGLDRFAGHLSVKLLCPNSTGTDPACGECKSCVLYRAGNHPDFIDVRPEEEGKQIKVEPVRDLIEFVQLRSQYGQYKISIIDPAENMNRSAANGLLKTLEEPPPESILILVSHQPSRIPVTIRSRCQRIKFHATADDRTLAWLQSHIKESRYTAAELLEMVSGGPLAALEMLEAGEEASQQALLHDLGELRAKKADPVRTAEKWQAEGAAVVLQRLQMSFGRMARLKLFQRRENQDKSRIIGYLQDLSNGLDLHQLVSCYDLALKNYAATTGPISLNQQGLLEDMIIHWQGLEPNQRGNE